MGNNPKVTIIIPAYNVQEYIQKGIESCITQTYSNLEIIIVDDGSEDETAKVIEKYSKQDERILFLKQVNGGVSSARNNALNHASGEYVIFLDSDDWLERNTVEILIKNLEQNEDSFIICSRYIVNESDCTVKVNDDTRTNNEIVKGEKILESFLYKFYYFQSSCYKLFDLQIIKKNKILFSQEISHGEDGLFVFEYLQHVKSVVSVPVPLWDILDRSGSASNSSFSTKKLTAIDAAEAMLKFNISDDTRIVITKYLIVRAETMFLEACEGGAKINKEALMYIKKKLKEYRIALTFPNTTFHEKIRYLYLVNAPFWLIEKTLRLKCLIR